MLNKAVDGDFMIVDDVADAAHYFASAKTSMLTGQSPVVSYGWDME